MTEDDIKFSDGQSPKVTVSATVKASGTSTSNFKRGGKDVPMDDEAMKEIKALNGGNVNYPFPEKIKKLYRK